MPKALILEVRFRESKTTPWFIDYRAVGKRRREYFQTKDQANSALRRIKQLKDKEGAEGLLCPNALRLQAMEAQQLLSPFPGKTVVDAARYYADYLASLQRSVSVQQLVEEYLTRVARADRSAVHLDDLRLRYATFCETFGTRQTRDITEDQIVEWLDGLELSPVSVNNFRSRLSSLFVFGKRKGYMDVNPCEKIDDKKIKFKAPSILTIEALTTLLDHATPEMLPMIAIGSFAGVRTAELMRLAWKDVNLQTRLIKISDSKNTSSRRFIPIQPNLLDWLRPYSGRNGKIWTGDINTFMRAKAKLTASAGVEWAQNNSRHSFCSYSLAAFNDLNQLRNDMGHASAKLIFDTYRELVTPDQGKRYFAIRPQQAANVLAMGVA